MALRTCVATAENLAVRVKQLYGYPFPAYEQHPDPRKHLGADASFEQCRAFEWGWLAATSRFGAEWAASEGNEVTQADFLQMQETCEKKVAEITAKENA